MRSRQILKAHVKHMAVVSHDQRIRGLNHRILESLLDPVAADVRENTGAGPAGISTIETEFEQARPTGIRICDPKLRTQISNAAVEIGAVMHLT